MFLGFGLNEYGTPNSLHACDTCQEPFSVCPVAEDVPWGGSCLGLECDSYDVTRDVDLIFDLEPWRIRQRVK